MNTETKYAISQYSLVVIVLLVMLFLFLLEGHYNQIDELVEEMGEETYYDIKDVLRCKYNKEPTNEDIANYYLEHDGRYR